MTFTHHHDGACLLPPRLTRTDSEESAAFFCEAYARDLIHAGFVTRGEARPQMELFADGVGLGRDRALAILDTAWQEREAEITGPGDEAAVAAALAALDATDVAVRFGEDCCRDAAVERVNADLPAGKRRFVAAGIDDLLKVRRGERLFLSYSAIEGAVTDVLPPELFARADGGDRAAQEEWLGIVHELETDAARTIVAALEGAGADVFWGGSTMDLVEVDVPAWRRPLPQD